MNKRLEALRCQITEMAALLASMSAELSQLEDEPVQLQSAHRINNADKAILGLIRVTERCTAEMIEASTRMSRTYINTRLNSLVTAGMLTRTSAGPERARSMAGRKKFVYTTTELAV